MYIFFQCTRYKDARKQLLQSVQKSWSDAVCKGIATQVCHSSSGSVLFWASSVHSKATTFYLQRLIVLDRRDVASNLKELEI